MHITAAFSAKLAQQPKQTNGTMTKGTKWRSHTFMRLLQEQIAQKSKILGEFCAD